MTQADWARALGRSPAWASYVMSGRCSLDEETTTATVQLLGLRDAEASQLLALVELRHGKTLGKASARATLHAQQLPELVEAPTAELIDAVRHWYIGAVLALARCEAYRPDPEWIAHTIQPPIEVEQAQHALEVLHALGCLCENGTLLPGREVINTPDPLPREVSAAGRQVHHHALDLISHTLDAVDLHANERFVVSTVLALSEQAFARYQRRMRQLIGEALQASIDSGANNRLYQFAAALVPASLYTDSAPHPSEVDDVA